MLGADGDRRFARQRGRREALVARFDRQLEAYRRAHPRAGEAELMAHAEFLLGATPGLTEAFAHRGLRGAVTAALLAHAATRWPGVDLSRGPWPDTSDLPSWADLAPHLDEDDTPDHHHPIPPAG